MVSEAWAALRGIELNSTPVSVAIKLDILSRLCIAMEKFWSPRLKLLQSKAFGDGFD